MRQNQPDTFLYLMAQRLLGVYHRDLLLAQFYFKLRALASFHGAHSLLERQRPQDTHILCFISQDCVAVNIFNTRSDNYAITPFKSRYLIMVIAQTVS